MLFSQGFKILNPYMNVNYLLTGLIITRYVVFTGIQIPDGLRLRE